MSNQPKGQPSEHPEDRAGRWLLNLLIWFLISPAVIVGSINTGYAFGALFGIALSLWRIMATPEITNYVAVKINWKGKKQSIKVQNSPGAQTVAAQGESVTQIIVPETQTVHELADRVYTPLRNEVGSWKDPRYANFSVWTDLDRQIPRLVKKVRPDIAKLLDEGQYLFKDIYVLRGLVSTLIRDESNKLAQEFQPKFFDKGSEVVFNNFHIVIDGQGIPFYLPHLWVMQQTTGEYVRTLVRENYPQLTKRRLELVVTGMIGGHQTGKIAATDEEATRFGDRLIEYLETQEPAVRLRRNLKRVQQLAEKILPCIDEELARG